MAPRRAPPGRVEIYEKRLSIKPSGSERKSSLSAKGADGGEERERREEKTKTKEWRKKKTKKNKRRKNKLWTSSVGKGSTIRARGGMMR